MPVNYNTKDNYSDFSKLSLFSKLTDFQFDVEQMQKDSKQIISEYGFPPSMNQICFTHTTKDYSDKNLLYEGCGSLTYAWDLNPYDKNGELKKRPVPLLEKDFTEFNQDLKGSYFYHIYTELSKAYRLGRFRLMLLMPKKCLSWHSDTEDRIHLAINTDPACRLVIEDECAHIPNDGFPYFCRTHKFHSAFNGSHKLKRLHLVIGTV